MTTASDSKNPELTIPIPTIGKPATPSVGDGFEPLPQPPPIGYRVGKLLGMGGEGIVHEAVQLSFGRQVAVKTLRSTDPSANQLRRFHAEAAITALLEHPNIVPVHDMHCDSSGRQMLVMKRIGGQTWRQLLDGEAPGPGKAQLSGEDHIEVLLKVCDAVAFAHARGILHRDLKPENVMVGEHGEVLLMDWGCATHLGPKAPHPDIPVLAELESTSGTPAYMSPEQARGDAAACGPWSDVHLLGGILYRMLTGTPPRSAGGVQATINLAIRGVPSEEPSARAGRKVPSELARIAMDALHPEPAKRTRSVDEFAASIRRYIEHREVHRLLSEARRQHELARGNGPDSDDAFRRALGAVEQAVQLWPEQERGRRMFIEVGLDSANHALEAGSFRLAKRQAQAVVTEANRLGDGKAIDAAGRVAALAETRERQAQVRSAHLKRLRRLVIAASLVAGLALLVGLLAAWQQSAKATAALADARREAEARMADGEAAAPALLALAREHARKNNFADGLPLVIAAENFARDKGPPHLLHAQLLIALNRRDEAVVELDKTLAISADNDVAELRRLCATPPADAEARISELLYRMGATGAIANSLDLASDQRLDQARKQLRITWPGLLDSHVSILPNRTLSIYLTNSQAIVTTLEPLSGMAVSSLDISYQTQVRDLSPLAALPLTTLLATSLGARDFTALKGLKLRRLALTQTAFSDLRILQGMPLEMLSVTLPEATTLEPLLGLPLRELRVDQCGLVKDLTGLERTPLEVLALEDHPDHAGSQLRDISALKGNEQLRELLLSNQHALTDISPLKGLPLQRVTLSGTRVSDLTPLANTSLKYLKITDTAVTDLRPLSKTTLEQLDFSPLRVQNGLDELKGIKSLRLINGFSRDDFTFWLALLRQLGPGNPDFVWLGRAVFSGGKAVELTLEKGIRTLDALNGLQLRSLTIREGTMTNLRVLSSMTMLNTLELINCKIDNLDQLRNHPGLRKVNLSGTVVVDLRPLATLKLEELQFSPTQHTLGINELRKVPSLQRIGIGGNQRNRLKPAKEFWQFFDAQQPPR